MMYGNWGGGGATWFGMGLGMLLFWGLVIVGLIVLVRWLSVPRRGSDPAPPQDALDILAHRYARGEIDRAEYEQKRRDLQSP